MQVKNAEIVISAVDKKQYPNDNLPEIALAGRSNVGKSSFINTILNRKKLARISGTPGKTRTLNFYKINDAFYFVDVPGFGYAQVAKNERAKWSKMMETYLTERENLQAVIALVDFRHEPTKEDLQLTEFLNYYHLPEIVVATKIDKIVHSKYAKHEKMIKNKLNLTESTPFILFSSQTKQGQEQAWQEIEHFL